MKLLLDTHVLVWFWIEPQRLSQRALDAISNPGNVALLSTAIAYEIEYKRDRDPVLAALPSDLEAAATVQGFQWLAISAADASAAGRLPRLHGDPWDRIFVAQARNQNAALVTADQRMASYPVSIIW